MTEKISLTLLQGWFQNYSSDLLVFFRRKVGESDADDLVQEVYLRALTYPMPSAIIKPRAFLFRVATNLVIDHVRKKSYRQHDNYEEIEGSIITSMLGPEDSLRGKDRLKKFRDALAQLPADHRQAFLLNRFDGLSHMEIAQLMGISDKTVQRYIAKAFDHCLSCIEYWD